MRHRGNHHQLKDREHHPQVGIGLFLIVLGLALLIATNDLLKLGSISSYFTWETAIVFIGILLLLNLNFTGGLLMIAIGTWFMLVLRSKRLSFKSVLLLPIAKQRRKRTIQTETKNRNRVITMCASGSASEYSSDS